ncbi:hypothetical protein JYT53_00085 [Cytophagaceae bacterium AH-315-L13]|nr:hypothetical protein [Cytophagaceae bacterium AH-315-L13]
MCSCKVEFTNTLRTQIESRGLEISKIQFYNSKEIILERELSSKEAQITSGEIILEQGKIIERIIIKKETPGICDSLFSEGLRIRFEQGNKTYLIFSDKGYSGSNYSLSADKWKTNNELEQPVVVYYSGILNYGGFTYTTNSFANKPILLVKKKEVRSKHEICKGKRGERYKSQLNIYCYENNNFA